MTLEEAIGQIKSCAKEMDARYGRTVFDEWAVISLAGKQGARAGLPRPAQR